jgi:hypothetical protein
MSDASANSIAVDYRGSPTPLLKLGLVTTFLTVMTLGIYRFWARARIRRYFWSALAPGGDALEYTGTGLEKFLGFLIAVAFLAVYLGLVQLGLLFAGLSMLSEAQTQGQAIAQIAAQYITVLAVLPLIFYAQYRGRRYILSRTRWRGLRFGVERAAFGYVWRGMVYSFVSLVTLGLLLPLQMFQLEKYKVDRTWFGTGRFEQGGHWWMLYPAAKHVILGLLIIVLPIGLIVFSGEPRYWAIAVAALGAIWLPVGIVYYIVHSFRILTRHKTLDGVIGFSSMPRTGKVLGLYILGSTAASLIASTAATLLLAVAGGLLASMSGGSNLLDFDAMISGAMQLDQATGLLAIAGLALFYMVFIVLFSALALVFIRQPLLAHYAAETEILNAGGLRNIRQRAGDEMVEAEGFADALDVGAGI